MLTLSITTRQRFSFGSGHCTWFNKDVDKMYLASEPIKKIAQARSGVPDEKIVMSGLPIRYDFAAQGTLHCLAIDLNSVVYHH